MIVSEAVVNAKADIDRMSVQIDLWAKDLLELLDGVKHLDPVFTETAEMRPSYIALCDWIDPSRLLIIQTIPFAASDDQLKMARAIVSVITALLFRFGHFDVGVGVLADTEGKIFRHEGLVARCKSIQGCARIPEAESQFNFSSIPGHVSRSASPVVLN